MLIGFGFLLLLREKCMKFDLVIFRLSFFDASQPEFYLFQY